MMKELIFVHGRPACGKDTLVDFIINSTTGTHKISGVYRSAFTRTGEYARLHDLVAPYMKPIGKGIDIPGKVVMDILHNIIDDRSSHGDEALFVCGLIRTVDHKKALDVFLSQKSEITVKHVYFSAPESMAIERAQRRMMEDSKSGKERQDDKVELMKARLERFKANTIPMLKELENEGKLTVIRADKSIGEVAHDFRNFIVTETSVYNDFTRLRVGERV